MFTHVPTRALGALLVAAGAVVAAAAPAQAAPQSCSTSQTFFSASSVCAAGTGEQRVAVFALSQITGATGGQYFYGPWVPAGATSAVSIPSPYLIPNWSPAFVQTRG
jgi:hypothetical protein